MMRPISRRTVLRGLGTAVALPVLEAMRPVLSLAGEAAKPAPKRLAFIYLPNGKHMADWTPTAEGRDFVLPYTLEPLKPFQKDLLVLTGLTLDKARPNGDGAGDHARAMAAFLTGSQPRKTHGADIKAGISADQVVAERVGRHTKFASLEIGCDGSRQAGNCDSGYSCAYSSNLSWRTSSTPMAKEINPRLVFERLFRDGPPGEADASRAKRDQYRRSVLDFVLDDARRLKGQLGATDQRKLDEYLSGVRDLELRIRRATEYSDAPPPKDFPKPAGTPKDYAEHIRLMADVLVLAFQADLTRVATFVFANDGSNRSYRFIGVPEGHHDLSHHGRNKDKQAKIRQINRFHITQLAYFLERLASKREGDKSLLDSCMVVYGSGISDGDRHNHDDLPILVAGSGGGSLTPGRHIRYPKETPLTNLYVSLIDRMGAKVERFGDSTGALAGLSE